MSEMPRHISKNYRAAYRVTALNRHGFGEIVPHQMKCADNFFVAHTNYSLKYN